MDLIFTSNEGDNVLWACFVVLLLPALERSCCCRYLHRFNGVLALTLSTKFAGDLHFGPFGSFGTKRSSGRC